MLLFCLRIPGNVIMSNPSTYSTPTINSANLITERAKGHLQSVDTFILLVGAFSSFYINVVGQLYIGEIILILLFPFLWIRYWGVLLKNRLTGGILLFGSLWFISQVFTDMIRQTPVRDLARGWAGILVLLISFSSLYILLGNNIRQIKIFAWGYALGGILSPLFQPSLFFESEPWKFGFGGPVSLLVLLLIITAGQGEIKRMRRWLWLIMAIGVLSLYLNARSLGGAMLLSGAIFWLRTSPLTRRVWNRLRVQNLFVISLLLFATGLALLEGYAYAAERGLLGQVVKSKFEMQYTGNAFSLLLGGRTEILASGRAILDSPWIGHGSWARNMKYRLYLWEITDLGYQRDLAQLEDYIYGVDLIPAHSHLTQAWVWAGFLGALFWGWVLVLIGKTFFRANSVKTEFYPLIIYFSVAATWDVLFSPFGSLMRMVWVLRFIMFLYVMQSD